MWRRGQRGTEPAVGGRGSGAEEVGPERVGNTTEELCRRDQQKRCEKHERTWGVTRHFLKRGKCSRKRNHRNEILG